MSVIDVQPQLLTRPEAQVEECCILPAGENIPWLRLVIGLFVAAQTMLFGLAVSLTPPEDAATRLLVHGAMLGATLVVMALLGWGLLVEAARELWRRRVTMELLFLAGIAGAFGASMQSMMAGEGPVYFDVVSILLIVYSIGRAISQHSRRKALSIVQSVTADVSTARRLSGTGFQPVKGEHGLGAHATAAPALMVDVTQIALGDRVLVMPGELIPVDGRIIEGEALVRQTPFTGESVSRRRGVGEAVLAGTGCEDASLVIEATAAGTQRRVDRLAELIDAARRSPTGLQRQADVLVRWFLPLVMVVAGGAFWYWTSAVDWHRGLFIALSILLIACPCAAGLATPLALWTVLGTLGRRGLILRSGDAVERLAGADGVIFDKTGTLGDDELALREIRTCDDPAGRARVLAIIAAVERCSAHPVARVLRDVELPADAPDVQVLSLRTLPGRGIEAEVDCTSCGTGFQPVLRRLHGLKTRATSNVRIVRNESDTAEGMLALDVAINGERAATALLEERLRGSAEVALEALRGMALPVQVMTGDAEAGAGAAAKLARTTARMTPEEKHRAVMRMIGSRQSADGRETAGGFERPLFVGDGLNDAAAMAASHVSVALAGGAAVTVQTASATLHGGDLRLVPEAVAMSRRAVRVIRSNLHWAVVYNITGIAVAAAGWLNPVLAALLMACSSALVAWRSFRVTEESAVDSTLAENNRSAEADPTAAARRFPLSSPHLVTVSHASALIGQGALLAVLAGLSFGTTSALVVAVFALAAWALVRWMHRLPVWADHIIGMIVLGGLGMNLGWWVDVGFAAAVADGQMLRCCPLTGGTGFLESSYWMYGGMLALGVPGMYLMRRAPQAFDCRRWCCIGPLVVGVPGMCLGMWAGALLAAQLQTLSGGLHVIISYVLMMSGMTSGMLLPHLVGRDSLPRRDVGDGDVGRPLHNR